MKDWKRIREAMDACRPDSRDLDDPEFRDVADAVQQDEHARQVFERSQRLDARLRQTIREVDIPEGLEQRLLSRLLAPTSVDAIAAATSAQPSLNDDSAQPISAQRTSRRRWLGASAAAVAVIILIAVTVVLSQPSTLTLQQLSTVATDWTNQALQDGDEWKPVVEEQATFRWRPHRWKHLDTKLDPAAVVLDLSRRGGKHLFVFQFKPKQQVVPLPAIPYQTLPASGQWHMGAWREGKGGVICIAVTNDRRLLESLKSTFRAA